MFLENIVVCMEGETGKGRGSSERVTLSKVPQKVTMAQSHRGAPGKGAATLLVSCWVRVAPGIAGAFAFVHTHKQGGLQGPRAVCPQGDTGAVCWE